MSGRIVRTNRFTVYYNSYRQYHREDGPAVEWADGEKWWFINGIEITDKVDEWREEMGITNDTLTPEETALFVLYFGNR